MATFRWEPPNEGVECRGYEKSTISRFISEMIQDTVIVTMRIGNRTEAFESYHFQLP